MLSIRLARMEEHEELEALQRRASLANEADRSQLEAHPDAIELPIAQIESEQVFVAERDGRIVGFAALLPEQDNIELDGLFVDPAMWRNGIGARLVDAATLEARQRGQSLLVVAFFFVVPGAASPISSSPDRLSAASGSRIRASAAMIGLGGGASVVGPGSTDSTTSSD